jgi:hypothetical protein
MRRLILGLGLGTTIAYGWRRLTGASPPKPQPPWVETDNDPEDAARVDDELLAKTRAQPEAQEEVVDADTAAPPIT